jgi:hypothetical protein
VQEFCRLKRCCLVYSIKDRSFVNVHDINDQAVVEISVIANCEAKTAGSAAVDLTLITTLVDLGYNSLIDVIVACP